jgi:hypothetical protein
MLVAAVVVLAIQGDRVLVVQAVAEVVLAVMLELLELLELPIQVAAAEADQEIKEQEAQAAPALLS